MDTEKLLSSRDVGEMFSCAPRTARDILSQHGLHPLNIGRGGKRVDRWVASDVEGLIYKLRDKAQKKNSAKKPLRKVTQNVDLCAMDIDTLFKLTQASALQ